MTSILDRQKGARTFKIALIKKNKSIPIYCKNIPVKTVCEQAIPLDR